MPDKVIITRSKLDNLATAIAAKTGASLPLTIDQMQAAVESMQTSNGTQEENENTEQLA